MYGDIYHFVASWLPDYARDNRNYLTVAIGCTGGRHRSVYLVERLAQRVRAALPGADAPSRTADGVGAVAARSRRALQSPDERAADRSRSPSPARRACRTACGCSNACSRRGAASTCSIRRRRRSSPSRSAISRCPRSRARRRAASPSAIGARDGQLTRVRRARTGWRRSRRAPIPPTRWRSARAAWARWARSRTASPTT